MEFKKITLATLIFVRMESKWDTSLLLSIWIIRPKVVGYLLSTPALCFIDLCFLSNIPSANSSRNIPKGYATATNTSNTKNWFFSEILDKVSMSKLKVLNAKKRIMNKNKAPPIRYSIVKLVVVFRSIPIALSCKNCKFHKSQMRTLS